MSTANCSDTIHASARRPRMVYAIALAWLARGVDASLLWAERARQRRQLAELDDYMLRDIGLSRADVATEVGKPFWQQ
jgi:uncharacterized protein YjiS (DUF1127 family)